MSESKTCWIRFGFKREELHDKKVKFNLETTPLVAKGTGKFNVLENDRGELSVQIHCEGQTGSSTGEVKVFDLDQEIVEKIKRVSEKRADLIEFEIN